MFHITTYEKQTYSSTTKYQLAQDAIKNEHYDTAYKYLSDILKKTSNYSLYADTYHELIKIHKKLSTRNKNVFLLTPYYINRNNNSITTASNIIDYITLLETEAGKSINKNKHASIENQLKEVSLIITRYTQCVITLNIFLQNPTLPAIKIFSDIAKKNNDLKKYLLDSVILFETEIDKKEITIPAEIKARYYFQIGNAYMVLNDPKIAKELFKKALADIFIKKIEDSTKQFLADTYCLLADAYYKQANELYNTPSLLQKQQKALEKAIFYYKEAAHVSNQPNFANERCTAIRSFLETISVKSEEETPPYKKQKRNE